MKNNIVLINDKQAKVSKKFMKRAMIYGTKEYYELKKFKSENENIDIVVRKIHKNGEKRINNKNLTYANMETYMKEQPNSIELLEQYRQQKVLASITPSPYDYVKKWFLNTLNNPDLSDMKYNKPINETEYEKVIA